MNWQPIDTAPKDGTVILAELDDSGDKHISTIAYWTVDALREENQFITWKKEDEFWSYTHLDAACEPVRWLQDFVVPEHIEFNPQ